MKAHWKIWTLATTEEKALRVVNRVAAQLGHPIQELAVEPYHSGGFVAVFVTLHSGPKWSDFVFEVIELAQRIGYSWTLTGDVRQQLDGFSNKPASPGVTSAQFICDTQLADLRNLAGPQ
jgi:hypothetical protein